MTRRIWGIVPAAGIGSRMQADCPKQYLPLAGRPLAEHTMQRLLEVSDITTWMVALHPNDDRWASLSCASHPRVHTCLGGASRAESVALAIQALKADGATDADGVLVHDMARPCIRTDDIQRLLASPNPDGAILAIPAVDTIKQAHNGQIQVSLDRAHIWQAQTPQFFPLGVLQQGLQQALQQTQTQTNGNADITDEASAVEKLGRHPSLMEGSRDNIKVTHPDDLPLAAFFLNQQTTQQ